MIYKIDIPSNKMIEFHLDNPEYKLPEFHQFYPYEFEEIEKQGVNMRQIKSVEIVPGLRERGTLGLSKNMQSTLDGYTIYLETKDGK